MRAAIGRAWLRAGGWLAGRRVRVASFGRPGVRSDAGVGGVFAEAVPPGLVALTVRDGGGRLVHAETLAPAAVADLVDALSVAAVRAARLAHAPR